MRVVSERLTNTKPLEAELLLLCARPAIDAVALDRVKTLLCSDIDWTYFLATVGRNRVSPLVFWSLSRQCQGLVPEQVSEVLQNEYQSVLANNMRLAMELVELTHLFAKRGVSSISFKGPTLAKRLYGNIALRSSFDLDILVKKRDLQEVRGLLSRRGYVVDEEYDGEEHWMSKKRRTFVDLHWRTDYYPSEIWSRSEVISFFGSPVHCFPAEDLLILLCLHGGKPVHFWDRLRWVCDIADLVKAMQGIPNWNDAMVDAANSVKNRRRLLLGLYLAQSLLEAPLPQSISKAIQRDPMIEYLAEKVYEHQLLLPHTPGERFIYTVVQEERVAGKLKRIWRAIRKKPHGLSPSHKDREMLRLPESLSFLYYVVRPIRIARDYTRVFIKTVLRH